MGVNAKKLPKQPQSTSFPLVISKYIKYRVKIPREPKVTLYIIFLSQTSNIIHKPNVISNAITNLATNGAVNQFDTPKSTNITSKGSIGNSLVKPESIKTSPTNILNI